MLKFDNVSFSYGRIGSKKQIIENFTLHTSAGECVVLAGQNGAGKSTLLSIAAGILAPDTGKVTRGGKIAYVPQGCALPEDMTVDECLRFFSRLQKCKVGDSLPFSVSEIRKKKVSSLSGGMKKQVSIACATLSDPEIILLDEPCAALDVIFRDEMIDAVSEWKKQNKTVVYVGHDPSEIYKIFDTIVFLGDEVSLCKRCDLANETSDIQSFTSFFRSKLLR